MVVVVCDIVLLLLLLLLFVFGAALRRTMNHRELPELSAPLFVPAQQSRGIILPPPLVSDFLICKLCPCCCYLLLLLCFGGVVGLFCGGGL